MSDNLIKINSFEMPAAGCGPFWAFAKIPKQACSVYTVQFDSNFYVIVCYVMMSSAPSIHPCRSLLIVLIAGNPMEWAHGSTRRGRYNSILLNEQWQRTKWTAATLPLFALCRASGPLCPVNVFCVNFFVIFIGSRNGQLSFRFQLNRTICR